mgnify:CR=1 FL=1
MCLRDNVEQCVATEVGDVLSLLQDLLRTRVRTPMKSPHVFFRECLSTAIDQHPDLCNEGYYLYIKEWYILSMCIIEHEYWRWRNPIDLTEE